MARPNISDPAIESSLSRGLNPNSQLPHAWNWKEGLRKPLPRYAPILPRLTTDPVELSFGQQRLWFLSQLESGSAAYHVPLAWRIRGAIDLTALQTALDQLVVRHEAIRTIFPAEGGHPLQVVTDQRSIQLEFVDLRSPSGSNTDQQLQQRLTEATQRPFDLVVGPVVRAALFRMADDEHVLVFVLHHIVCDGPSIAILLEELGLFYGGFASGNPIHLPQPQVQYADFAIWQRDALIEEVRNSQLTYWKEELHDCPAALDFPSDSARPVKVGFRGGIVQRDLSRELSDAFRALAREVGVTRFMALLALFQVLLSRYTGDGEISVGCPMTHRIRAEVSRVVGFFANMMVMRSRLQDNPTFRDLLRRTREVALGAYAHQDLPFEQLVAELQPERVQGRNPFFQAMLVVEESAWRRLDLPGLECRNFSVHNDTAKFDFSLYVIDYSEGFRMALEYNSDLFEPETIDRLLEHYENLLQAAVSDPDRRVLDLPLLSSSEREIILRRWNQTGENYPRNENVPQLFQAQVERTPEAIAVRFQDTALTYRDLNSQANRLARHLMKLGAGRERLVAVCMERSLEMIVALLAVMKSGAAYLPLDPAHPLTRREAILRDCGASIILTDQDAMERVPCFVISLPEAWASIRDQSESDLQVSIEAHDLAYVIYTSGSTGLPKGVEVEHGNLNNLLAAMRKRPGLLPNDTLLAVTTVSFDIAGLELWLPLVTGASVVLASHSQATDGRSLIQLLEKPEITFMQATPATWRMLLAAGWKGSPRLKILCGGEALPRSLAEELLTRCNSVWNMYGPTETTIWSSIHSTKMSDLPRVPIGRPIGNTTMYVLDQRMEPVPFGVRGELYIGGEGVARGYHGAPQLTAEKFVTDPFSAQAGLRLYRTGDWVRQRRDGTLEFLERHDSQVKIRGFRIELGEIQAALTRHPGVGEAALQAREDSHGNKHLVAYVVPKSERDDHLRLSSSSPLHGKGYQTYAPHRLDDLNSKEPRTFQDSLVSQLRESLQTTLPDYMMPSAFVVMDALPLTPNGKLDWKALPAPERKTEEPVALAPRDRFEARLAKIWEEVLDLHPVGVTDNFFELGGDSLLSTRLFARVEEQFGKHIPLGALFEAPTVRKLAAILRRDSWTSNRLIQVQAGDGVTPPIFFVQARAGYYALAAELGPEQPVYVVPYDDVFLGNTERELGDVALELAQRIRAHQPHGPYALGGMCLAGRVAFAIARELRRQGEDVPLLAIVDMWAPGYDRSPRRRLLQSYLRRLQWHLRYALSGTREQKMDWVAGGLRALSWQMRYWTWRLARLFFRHFHQSLPPSLHHPTWLMAEAAQKDPALTYPGHITLFRPSERTTGADESDLGWGRLATLGVDVHEIAGLKRNLLRANVAEVGPRLRECLARMRDQALSTKSKFSSFQPPG